MPIKVLGSGYGRTGTMSLKLALEQLGFGPCYHMVELFKNAEGIKHWEQAGRQEAVNWDELFMSYRSIVDFPGAIYFEEMAKYYPEAKVIHTVRDPEDWYESAKATIFSFDPGMATKMKILLTTPFSARSRHIMRIIQMHQNAIWSYQFEKKFEDKDYAIENFKRHTQRVQDTIPADRLLVFDVREGWEPLCKFLEVSVPSEPFPRSNAREGFAEMAKAMI